MLKEVYNKIRIDGCEIENTPEAVREFHERRRVWLDAQFKKDRERAKQEATGKLCPFDRFADSPPECKTSCALYRGNGCAMKHNEPAQDTKGKKCPFMRACVDQCALYCGGCTI